MATLDNLNTEQVTVKYYLSEQIPGVPVEHIMQLVFKKKKKGIDF